MVAAHDLAQWVALMLARRTEARLGSSEVEIALAADERTTLANLSLTNHAIRRKIQSAPPLECVRLSGEELCQLLMALSTPLSSARANGDSFLSNLATKLLEHVKQLL